MAATLMRAPPASQGNRMLLLVLFSSTFALCASQDVCGVPSLDRNVLTVPGAPGVSFIYTTPQSSCSGRVVGYWFCYQNVNTGNSNVRIATALVLQDRGQNYNIIQNFEVEAKPREDNCSSDRCCATRRLDPFEVDLQLYGLVIPERPNAPVMIQTHSSSGSGYLFNSNGYDPENNNNVLIKQTLGIASTADPTPWQVKMFQFLIDNSTSNTSPTDDAVLTTPTVMPTSTVMPTPTVMTTPTVMPTSTVMPTPTVMTTPTVMSTPTPDTDTTSSSAPPTLPMSTMNATEPQTIPTPTPVMSLVIGMSVGLVILVLVIVVIIVIIVLILVVMKKRNKDYVLQQWTESHGFTNPLYTAAHPGSVPKEVELRNSGGHSPSSANKLNTYIGDLGKSEKYSELPHEYCMPDEIRGARVVDGPQEYSYAVSTRKRAPLPTQSTKKSKTCSFTNAPSPPHESGSSRKSDTGIYMTPAKDEHSLYAQFNTIRIKQIPRDAVKVLDHLGSGQFGTVDKGVWQSPGGDVEVALKTLNPGVEEVDKVKFLQEAAIMGQFSHPNVVKLYGVITVGEPMMIVLELLPKGDLRNLLLSMRAGPGEEVDKETPHTLLSYCRQIASGMCYLAQKSFVHRDLAARNILVAEDAICKVADFGMSRDLEDENYYISHGGKIPVKWSAPEALLYRKYSAASDVWSYGVLMYEIWSLGHKPFEGYTNNQAMKRVERGYRLPPPPGCPRSMYELMIQCWHPQTSERPTFIGVLQSLSLPDTRLLWWNEEDKAVHPEVSTLGAELETAVELYRELQRSHLCDDYDSEDP